MAVLQGVSTGDATGTGPAGGGRSREDEMPAPEARMRANERLPLYDVFPISSALSRYHKSAVGPGHLGNWWMSRGKLAGVSVSTGDDRRR